MMPRERFLFDGRARREQSEPPVNLESIRANQFAADPLGECDGELRFADPGRAGD
jgi:hypothetical protein